MRLWVSSSTVSLKASLGLWPLARKHVVLRVHDAGQGAHEHAALAGEVAEDFLLEGGREQVARAHRDAESHGAILGAAGGVLLDGEAAVDAGARQEVAAHVQARALGRDHDDVHVGGRNHAGLILIDDGEAVREIDGVALLEVLLDRGPDGLLRGVRHQHLNDGALLGRFLDFEQGLARHPAVGDGAIPVPLERGRLADDDVEAIVLHVERLGRTLDAIADHRDGLVLENLERLLDRELFARDDFFFDSTEIDRCHGIS
jgi:hypothetical protein